jgi:hypothetical protein
MWSTIQPPIGETRIPGIADTAATKPAKAGESVRSRISQGIVIMSIELPSPDAKLETWRRIIGARLLILLIPLSPNMLY